MTEISTMLLALLVEGLVVLIIIVIVLAVLAYRRRRKDRATVDSLVQDFSEQSSSRRQSASDFLQQKYFLQGDELDSVLNNIDNKEKKFLQHYLNTYLNRDSHGLTLIDGSMAELIEVYKGLTPPVPQAEPAQLESFALIETDDDENLNEDIKLLQQSNDALVEELKVSRQTMADMIAEFGSLFGGAVKHEMPQRELMDKLNKYKQPENRQPEISQRFNQTSPEEVRLDWGEEDDVQIHTEEVRLDWGEEDDAQIHTEEVRLDWDEEDNAEIQTGSQPENNRLQPVKKDKELAQKQPDTPEKDKFTNGIADLDKKKSDEKDADVVGQNEIDDLLDSIDLSSDR